MISTMKSPNPSADSLSNVNALRSASPLKTKFPAEASDSPSVLSDAIVHKRRPKKRVRFALKLEPVEEDSLPSSQQLSVTLHSKSNQRVADPWRHGGPLYGAYVEYLEKQDAFTNTEAQIRLLPPPPPPPAPEPGAEPPTYTHTFVIQSKSPELIIDSITVSTPPFHLPRILNRTKKTNKHSLPALDSYFKQQLNLSTSPRMTHARKPSDTSTQKSPYASVQAALRRAESVLPPTPGLHANNRIIRADNHSPSKSVNEPISQKKMTEIINKSLPGANHQINHFSERSILPSYLKKPRVHSRNQRSNEELNSNAPYFYQNHESDYLTQPIVHSSR